MTKDDLDLAFALADQGVWSPDMVLLRFVEAVHTVRALPEKHRPREVRSVMPSFIDENPEKPRRPIPKDAIDRMEEAMNWYADLCRHDVKRSWALALWVYSEARNGKFSLKKAASRLGVSPPTLHYRQTLACEEISDRLQTQKIIVRQPDYDMTFHRAVK